MGFTSHRAFVRQRTAGLLLALCCPAWHPALAADDAQEREQLATISHQIDLIDRLTEHASDVAPQAHARYHFDYVRLRDDLKHIRAGIQDYLVPLRAQPHDPVPLAGDYVHSSPDTCGDTKEVSKP